MHKESTSLDKRSLLLDQYFMQSAVRFCRRHAPVPFIPISFMLLRMLVKRLAIRNLGRVRAVLKGFLAA